MVVHRWKKMEEKEEQREGGGGRFTQRRGGQKEEGLGVGATNGRWPNVRMEERFGFEKQRRFGGKKEARRYPLCIWGVPL